MPWFRVFALGEDFPVVLEGQVEIVGFYTTRYVEADTAGEAEAIASELLFEDPDLETPPGYEEYQPRLVFEEVEQVNAPVDIDDNFSFFPMEEEDEEY